MTRSALFLVVLALVASACGGDATADTTPPETLTTTSMAVTTTEAPATTTTAGGPDDGFPVTIEAPNGPVTIEERPDAIVSISPTATEVLFAVGAGDQVVAVDSLSNYPPQAPVTDLSAFSPSVEAIAAYEPDLVFMSYDPTGDLIPGLEAIGVPVILHGTALDVADAYAQWEQTGAATGHVAEAAALVASTQDTIDSALAEVPESAAEMAYYFELDPTFFSITSTTFIGQLIAETGMTNIADPADEEGIGYPQLSSEYIVGSDPHLILLADTKCCAQDAATVAERPGWSTLTAVEQGQIVELDDDVASRWGPRIASLVEDVVVAILEIELANA